MLWPAAATGEADTSRPQYTRTRPGASRPHGCPVTKVRHPAQLRPRPGGFRGSRGLTTTSDGLRPLQDLRRSLLDPPRPLQPRTVTATREDNRPENVSATA